MPDFHTFDVPARGDAPVLKVKQGETWRFVAKGRWLDGFIACGPDGHRIFLWHVLDIRPPLEDAPWFCLVGRYKGEDRTEFRIGAGAVYRFERDGVIEFVANDLPDRQRNNSGSANLTAEKLAGPPPATETICSVWRLALPDDEPRSIKAYAKALLACFNPLWRLIREVFDRTTGLVFIATMILVAGAALAFLPQGQDLVRSMSEDRPVAGDLSPGYRQAWFGLALFVLCMQAWFWPRVIINFNYGSDRSKWRPGWFLNWTPRILGVAPVVYAVLAIRSSPEFNLPFVVASTVAPLAFFIWIIFRHDRGKARRSPIDVLRQFLAAWKAGCPPETVDQVGAKKPDRIPARVGRLWVVIGLILAVVSVILLCLWPVEVTQALGAPAVVFFGFALLIPPATILIQTGAPIRFPVLGVAISWAIFLSIVHADHEVGRRAGGALPESEVKQVDLKTAYTKWKAQALRGKDGLYPVVLVASEGGASRAGYWTGEVLSELEARTGGALSRSVFAISSVSGGSVGAVGYAAALQDHRGKSGELKTQVTALTGADALSPVVGGFLYTDLINRFVPFGFPDRGEALERAWEDAWQKHCKAANCPTGRLREPFLNIWRDDDPKWTPLVIVNGASEENGRRIVTSKLALQVDQVNVDDFYATTGRDVAASTAIHNGARFPYISPAGLLVDRDKNKRGHIVDGGYFDPAGTEVVRELAHAIKRVAGEEAKELKFIFVYIGYGDSVMRQTVGNPQTKISGSNAPTKYAANELLAPIRGLVASRDAHARHMARNLKADVSLDGQELSWNEYAAGPNPGANLAGTYVPILLCNNPENEHERREFIMPMDWALSKFATARMEKAVELCGSNRALVGVVVNALRGLTEPDGPAITFAEAAKANAEAAKANAARRSTAPAPPTPAPAQPR